MHSGSRPSTFLGPITITPNCIMYSKLQQRIWSKNKGWNTQSHTHTQTHTAHTYIYTTEIINCFAEKLDSSCHGAANPNVSSHWAGWSGDKPLYIVYVPVSLYKSNVFVFLYKHYWQSTLWKPLCISCHAHTVHTWTQWRQIKAGIQAVHQSCSLSGCVWTATLRCGSFLSGNF